MSIKTLLKSIRTYFHVHDWRTTHVSRLCHPTRQVCECGDVRVFSHEPSREHVEGMLPCNRPWKHGQWVHVDGSTSEYSVLD